MAWVPLIMGAISVGMAIDDRATNKREEKRSRRDVAKNYMISNGVKLASVQWHSDRYLEHEFMARAIAARGGNAVRAINEGNPVNPRWNKGHNMTEMELDSYINTLEGSPGSSGSGSQIQNNPTVMAGETSSWGLILMLLLIGGGYVLSKR